MSELLGAPVTALAAEIRARRVSPSELLEAHIDRIAAVNPIINALTAERFERARAEARSAEQVLVRGGPLPPLLGVPCTVKAFLEVDGMPHDVGLVSRRAIRAGGDATVVERLRRAGAVIMGQGNVPEGGMWMETYNKLHGRTCNPWNGRHTCGGSSGGEAALVASGASPFGIGSDVAGSIRIPSAFCGVAGHKPTGRMVPNTGHWGPGGATNAFLTSGPIGRSVADLELILEVIAGPDGIDPLIRDWPPARRGHHDLRGVVVYPVVENGHVRMSPVVVEQVRRAAAALAERGAEVREVASPLRKTFSTWTRAMQEAGAGGPSFAEILGNGQPISLGAEVVRSLFRRSSITVPALSLAVLESIEALLPRGALGGRSAAELQRELEALLGTGGVILHPPYPSPAPRHNVALLRPFDFVCTSVFNITELPVTQVPTGFDRRGLPVGVQVAARRGGDGLTLAVARALEEHFGPWRRAEPQPC